MYASIVISNFTHKLVRLYNTDCNDLRKHKETSEEIAEV